jgi:hypothetical protein
MYDHTSSVPIRKKSKQNLSVRCQLNATFVEGIPGLAEID